ncbi:MAG: UbiA family prenyltransferase [Euryarchaeota archaeon]|nr:UbiA family prenyltransferase [Euryarchaeota archaeon]MBU4608210.1 UbiA family prenyltransferase [Euryarchaeota archaeon]MBV1728936.1 UbiA family prenyltransferase [Methanobacterium sp.]MBV1755684.1 UbiA family prenyltransferase [Methanobacterium sp.]MBV1768011.1 UbiA family prenyltransferase [Methanobacterium sp.]
MNAYLEILRPGNALMAVITIVLMVLISGNFNIDAIVACTIVFIATGAGNSINDYFDYKIDAINRPERPMPSGRISQKNAGIYSAVLFVVATLLGFLIGIIPGIIVLSSSLLMIYYAYSLKKMCLVGNITISFLTGLSFVLGGVVLGELLISFYLGIFAFLMTMAREIVKDMEDMEGDKKEGAHTLPLVKGKFFSARMAAFFVILASISSPILYFLGIFNLLYLVVLMGALGVFIKSAVSLLQDQSHDNTKNISHQIKKGMAITFLAFALGSPLISSFFSLII